MIELLVSGGSRESLVSGRGVASLTLTGELRFELEVGEPWCVVSIFVLSCFTEA